MKITSAVIAALFLGSLLSACGGGSDDAKARAEAVRVTAYCAALKADAKTIRTFDRAKPDYKDMQHYFDVMRAMKKKAPADLSEEWSILDYNIAQVEKAAKAANMKFSVVPKILKGKLPKGVKANKLSDVVTAFTGLNGGGFETAIGRINSNAKKVCKVDLGATAG